MPTVDKIDVVLLTLAFIVPGFLINCVLALFVARKNEAKEILFLRFLSFSALNLISCLWLIRYLLLGQYLVNRTFFTTVCFFHVTFINPIFLGLFLALLDRNDVIKKVFAWRFLKRLKLIPLHPTPAAWDRKFRDPIGCWVVVTLKDGSEVYGMYGEGAYVSTDSAERDLYLNLLYDGDEENPWIERPRTGGILVKADAIQSVEFIVGANSAADSSKDSNNVGTRIAKLKALLRRCTQTSKTLTKRLLRRKSVEAEIDAPNESAQNDYQI